MERDTRLVQTAVLGAASSYNPVIMPMTRFEALHFLNDHAGTDFWCGTWLGGCGRQLATRVGKERIPHFAHYPDRRGLPSSCHRIHNGRRSADHLFVNRDLGGWLRVQGRRPVAPVLDGDFQAGGTCTSLQIGLQGDEGLITVVFKGYDLTHWRHREDARPKKKAWFNWLFGPGVLSPQALLDRDGYALHLRLDWTDGASDIEIGTRARKGRTEWVDLSVCTIAEHGISTPRVAEIRAELRKNRTVIATAAPQPEPKVPVAPGKTVPLTKLRRVVLLIGREQAMTGDMERAGLCARLAREMDHDAPQLPPWLWTEVRRVLRVPNPGTVAAPAPVREVQTRKVKTRGALPSPAPRQETTEFPASARLVPLDRAIDSIPLDDTLIDFLTATGWSVRANIEQMRWLRLATVHSSYLYESGLSEIVDHSVLRALEEVSKRHISIAALDRYVATHDPKKVGQQSREYTEYVYLVREAIAAQPVIAEAALLGKGEAGQSEERRTKAPAVVARQIVGAMALLGGHQAVRRLVERALSDADSSPVPANGPIDWRTVMERHTSFEKLTWEWSSSGPDHDLTFKARVRDGRGRTAEGSGTSKRAANREAAESYLRRHMPEVWSEQCGRNTTASHVTPPAPRSYRQVPHAHRTVVNDLMKLFELPDKTAPYLTQALTHSSWIQENTREAQIAWQRDNTLLAHHGAVVADLLMAHHRVRAVLSRTSMPEPGEISTLIPEESIWRDLFARMRLDPGLLLGSGQRSQPEPAYANAMQAVLAVAWRTHGALLLSRRPAILDEWLRSHSPDQDPATRLQRTCAVFNVQLDFSFRTRGEDHRSEYSATVSLHDGVSQVIFSGSWVPGGKTTAKKCCAAYILEIVKQITHSEIWNLHEEDRKVAAFLLRAQIRNAAHVRHRDLPWCSLQGHLGISYLLAHDHDGYEAWSRQVKDLIGDVPTESDPRLSDFYHRCTEIAR